ncbi:DUF3515 family protein [Nocardia sp. NPDC059180]|uniref:DUF3515 domain-containing protein n=1 Tax=Nocardia sp. NPDC059180 TaxID=3346761 RepID=UPI0036A1F9AB
MASTPDHSSPEGTDGSDASADDGELTANAGKSSADGDSGAGSAEAEPSGAPHTDADAAESDSDDAEPDAQQERAGYPPALIATAVALPVALVIAVLVAAILASRMPVDREPLALGSVPAPAIDSEACTTLLPALPAELGEFTKSTLVEPAPKATRAWQLPDGGEPIVLRCGLDRPLEFNRASPIQMVNKVAWFEIADPAADASTWFVVDRATYIALTIPGSSDGPTPLQAVSDAITANLPEQPMDPGPLPN